MSWANSVSSIVNLVSDRIPFESIISSGLYLTKVIVVSPWLRIDESEFVGIKDNEAYATLFIPWFSKISILKLTLSPG